MAPLLGTRALADLPTKNGWRAHRFEEMAIMVNDRIDDPSEANVEYYVGLEHLESDSLIIRRWGSPSDVEATKLRFSPGDIIFGRRRVYQRKLAVADFDGICSAHAMVLRAKPEVALPEFLPFFMQSDLFMGRAVEISVGSLSPTINWKTLAKEEFVLPALEEQRKIASLLRASSSSQERLRALRARMSMLLASAVEDLAIQAIEAGSVVPLGELIEQDRPITYGILMPGQNFPGGVPVIKVKDFPDGRILEQGLLRTDPKIDEEYRRSRLREGDLLISIRGTVGRLAVVPPSLRDSNITQDTARLALRKENDASFIRAMLGSRFVQRQIAGFVTGLAVKGINIGELRQVLVPIADRRQQVALSREVAEIRLAVERCDARFEAAKKLHAVMLHKLTEQPQ
jgi:hypothetical protein